MKRNLNPLVIHGAPVSYHICEKVATVKRTCVFTLRNNLITSLSKLLPFLLYGIDSLKRK
jgi:hypothetical protein